MDKMNLVSIYKVPDEQTGVSLRDLIRHEGIEAFLRSAQIPMYDSVMTMGIGYWGDIVVKEEDAPRAREVIDNFLREQE